MESAQPTVKKRPLAKVEEFAERFNSLVSRFGTQAALARAAGLHPGTIQKYASGGEPLRPALVAIARAAGVSVEWLATGEGPMRSELETEREKLGEYIFVPRYNVRAAAGAGAVINDERVVDHLAFKSEWVHRALGADPARLLLIEAMGDSMAPTIDDGDLLLVCTREPHFRDDGVYLIRRDQGLSVKRLRRRPGGAMVISSDNPNYGSDEIPADQVDLVGRVIWSGGKL